MSLALNQALVALQGQSLSVAQLKTVVASFLQSRELAAKVVLVFGFGSVEAVDLAPNSHPVKQCSFRGGNGPGVDVSERFFDAIERQTSWFGSACGHRQVAI